ncbi:hypothetical protein LMF89_11500 [Pelosinus sp. Bkl1]|uniref:Uncharacterized protein n=1 Tax=Pelosinus baikalensis TaxID=2892015 RepID=A0ABS8HS37_9FIRM|nr:hypothetical protein [Pelosinus baikalensis]
MESIKEDTTLIGVYPLSYVAGSFDNCQLPVRLVPLSKQGDWDVVSGNKTRGLGCCFRKEEVIKID